MSEYGLNFIFSETFSYETFTRTKSYEKPGTNYIEALCSFLCLCLCGGQFISFTYKTGWSLWEQRGGVLCLLLWVCIKMSWPSELKRDSQHKGAQTHIDAVMETGRINSNCIKDVPDIRMITQTQPGSQVHRFTASVSSVIMVENEEEGDKEVETHMERLLI